MINIIYLISRSDHHESGLSITHYVYASCASFTHYIHKYGLRITHHIHEDKITGIGSNVVTLVSHISFISALFSFFSGTGYSLFAKRLRNLTIWHFLSMTFILSYEKM